MITAVNGEHLEQPSIVDLIHKSAGKPLTGKAIALRVNKTYDATFRVLLRNLANRGCITKAAGGWVPGGQTREKATAG